MAADATDGVAMWIDAGLAEMASSGVDGVRVEVLAQNLGITKGGFYRRFKDRRALLDAMLDTWAEGRVEAIVRQMELDGLTPSERLNAVIHLFAERVNAQGMAIELAIRQWAHADAGAAAAVARVDVARQEAVTTLYGQMGFPPAQAQARALLFYAFIFGQGLLFLHIAPAERARLVAACADVLTDVEGDGTPRRGEAASRAV